jgi:hypothetical protein
MTDTRRTIIRARPERAASVAALTTAAGAVACGVCCVLAFALFAVAVASTGSVLAWFADAQWWAIGLAAVILGGLGSQLEFRPDMHGPGLHEPRSL